MPKDHLFCELISTPGGYFWCFKLEDVASNIKKIIFKLIFMKRFLFDFNCVEILQLRIRMQNENYFPAAQTISNKVAAQVLDSSVRTCSVLQSKQTQAKL